MSTRPMLAVRCYTQSRRDRVAELLAELQLGTCPRCGRASYPSRRPARHAARIASPGTRLRAYRCGVFWHLGTPAGRREVIGPPVTVRPDKYRGRPGLDLGERGERACAVPPDGRAAR